MLNMDFSLRVVIDTSQEDWQPSPKTGVWRKPLAREDAESGHATSVVRYDPGANFNSHNHPLGEEILVLEGTFSDATGNFPAGTYFRNPKGFIHAPYSETGCIILVKLHQFQADDHRRLSIDTKKTPWQGESKGLQRLMLHRHHDEEVCMLNCPAGYDFGAHEHPGGEEIFVIAGELADEAGNYRTGCWLRHPPGSSHRLRALSNTLLWLKKGHLC